MKNNNITLLFLLLIAFAKLGAQDMHFSQFYTAPLTLNPAMTGLFDGKYRVALNYRNQWNGPFKRDAYKTFAVGMDVNFPVKRTEDFFSGGLMFYSDKVGAGKFSSTQAALSGAYFKSLDFYGKNIIGAGFQAGFLQRNVNYGGLSFDDQFNGVDGYTLGTNEALPRNSFSIVDLGTGVFYIMKPKKNYSFYAGAALHHFTRPDVSFSDDPEAPKRRLFMKTTVQLGGQFPLGNPKSSFLLQPRMVMFWQGPHLELNAGSNLRIRVTPYGDAALHVGASARTGKNSNGFGLDAAVLQAGFEYNGLMFGFSYDVNITDIAAPGPQRSAFEISVSYIGNYEVDAIACPTF